jgi:lysophospholipase L1-like esterase
MIRRAARLLALAAVQCALVVLLLEAAGRLFDPLGISYYPETARYLDTLVLEEPIGYRNRPGLRGTYYGVPVSINSLGMRGPEVPDKAPGEFRILVMGDSVPFGIGVRYEDALPQQLERVLGERHPGRRFRALNMGVPSYNTEQELIQLRTLGIALAPDAVILFFASNDIEPKMWVLERRSRWYANLAQRSYAASLLFVLARELRQRLAAAGPGAAHAAIPGLGGTGIALEEFRADSPRWLAVERSLAQMNDLARARGIPFVLFTHDEADFILELLRGVAAREGFPVVNLRRQEDPRWAGMDPALFHNSRIDSHPTPLGNRVLATLAAESLERLGALRRSP